MAGTRRKRRAFSSLDLRCSRQRARTAGRGQEPVRRALSELENRRAKRGYTGPAAIAITLDELLRAGSLSDGKFVLSFVTESSKWMNAGFLLRYRA